MAVGTGYVQVPPDSTGKKIDVTEITRPDTSTVERERVDVPDGVSIKGDLAEAILVEMMLLNTLMASAFGITDSLDEMRSEIGQSIGA
jgi:nicotinic acid phosphoribosyltransferase